ncbi:MAG: hypothetical protein IJL76_00460 [Bacilli bacterium]|nr:hypothetical protein [Bacilli bacterium]
MYNAVMNIVNSNKDKKIAIISHATATICLLKEWCDVTMIEDKLRYSFNNKLLLDGKFDYCEILKIDFNDNEVVNIENIKMN